MLPIQIFNYVVLAQEERRETLRQLNLEKRIQRRDSDPFALPENQFCSFFRLTREMVHHILLPRLVPHLTKNCPFAIDPIAQILVTFTFYASGEYQRCLGNNFRMPLAQPTVSKIVSHVTSLIIQYICPEWIVFPSTREDLNRVKERFMDKTGFPEVIGAIDCTHIRILAPPDQEHNYLNRKGYHSKNVQLVCNYDCLILNVNAQWGGATHDAFIFRNSALCTEMERRYNAGERNSWLLGDSGYPQKPYLMTPILNALPGTPEINYTNHHVRTRVCIERCNGILKARFRCLGGDRKLRYSPENVGNIMNACAALHNICIQGRLHLDVDVPIQPDQDVIVFQEVQGNDAGMVARRALVARYFA